MEADFSLRRVLLGLAVITLVCFSTNQADAANKRTRNFIVFAPNPQLAEAVGEAAERYRRDLAVHWLGGPLPPWPAPCPIRVIAGDNLAAQGVTTYNPAPVRDFQMEVVGTPERILDSVLPHEVTHTILATYFGRPLPRWADEGICTTVEHISERGKHETKLREFLNQRRGIAMNQLFLMTEYPSDVLPMYAQGYSVCQFLIGQKGPQTFIAFLGDYMKHPSWTDNVRKHYQYESLAELQEYWLSWVAAGSGPVEKYAKVQPQPAGDVQLASAQPLDRANSQTAPAIAVSPGPATQQLAPPRNPAVSGQAASQPAATALASTVSGGWYQRKREEVVQADAGGSSVASAASRSNAIQPMVPPSIANSGPYQSAHPQPEQGISRPAARIGRLPDSGRAYR